MKTLGIWRIGKTTRPLLCAVIAVVLTSSFSGCSPATGGRVAVGGTVLLDGTMLDRGTIEFHPLSAGTITGGTIRDGRFEIPAATGAIPGMYEVRIFSTNVEADPTLPEDLPPGPESTQRPLQPERIHNRYNVESELTADIPDEGAMNLAFKLEA